jgi:hypothetical protein
MLGLKIGNYKITSTIGDGGVGTAYRAVHECLDGSAAVLLPEAPGRKHAALALALVIASAGCGGTQPYQQLRGSPVIATQVDTTLSDRGFRLALATQCQRQVVDLWCPPGGRAGAVPCRTPPTVYKEAVGCPPELAFRGVQIAIRAPWGGVYSAVSDANGVVEIPVNWSNTGVDPLAAGVAEQLAAGWLVYVNKTRAIPLKIEPADIERMQIAIGAATDTQYEVGAANEKAVLAAELGEAPPLVPGRPGTISLAIKNSGPQPAYRVIAKLRSSVDALHGHQLSFGRIDPGKTKIKTRVVALPSKLDERSALVVADISYFNGEPFETKKKLSIAPEAKRVEVKRVEPPRGPEAKRVEVKRVEPPRGLDASCKLATAEVAPGERVRIDCELRNLGNAPANELTIAVAVRGAVSKNLAPKVLPGAGSVKLELVGLTAASEQQGAQVPVVVRVGALGLPPVEQTLTVRIASFATRCQTRLTRDEYKAKRKRLQAALDSGALTQQEFDKYDADLVGCLQ